MNDRFEWAYNLHEQFKIEKDFRSKLGTWADSIQLNYTHNYLIANYESNVVVYRACFNNGFLEVLRPISFSLNSNTHICTYYFHISAIIGKMYGVTDLFIEGKILREYMEYINAEKGNLPALFSGVSEETKENIKHESEKIYTKPKIFCQIY